VRHQSAVYGGEFRLHVLHCDLYSSLDNNVLISKLLHVSGLIGPTSGSAQLYKTIVQTFCLPKYVELLPRSSMCECKDGRQPIGSSVNTVKLQAAPNNVHISIIQRAVMVVVS
jgi:hypothetical protein